MVQVIHEAYCPENEDDEELIAYIIKTHVLTFFAPSPTKVEVKHLSDEVFQLHREETRYINHKPIPIIIKTEVRLYRNKLVEVKTPKDGWLCLGGFNWTHQWPTNLIQRVTDMLKMVAIKDLKRRENKKVRDYSTEGNSNIVQDILKEGLLNPIRVTEDNVVIDGWKRVLAFQTLGWPMITAYVVTD
jgi:hypothetical protein